ncbi:MAG: TonB-dependent receptor [Tannerella sp.]|nr:TonB-dependent receptor [Tannerella sp.]
MKVRKFFWKEWPSSCLRKGRLLCVCLLLASAFGAAKADGASGEPVLQQSGITGYVYDVTGEPVTGANVVVKGTAGTGTVTDVDGRFMLNVPAGTELEISFIGFQTQTVKAAANMKVTLLENAEALEEVVVIGYGTVKKSDLTGAVSSVSAKAFLDQPASSVNSVLSGRAPGVTVKRSNGAPGSGSIIRVRGANSLLGSNDPLVVVDGNYGGMPNMYDIESIEILKDASATAIYGSRGANGVILVKTKRGTRESKPTAKVYADISIDDVPQRYDLMNAYEYAEYNNSVGAYPFTDEELAGFRTNSGVDWQDAIMRTGLSQQYKVVLEGGARNVRYYVSPSYSKTTGIIRNTEAGGYGLNAKIDMDLSDRITVQVETSASHGSNMNPNMLQGGDKTSIPLVNALTWSPTVPMYNEDGTLTRLGIASGTALNPVLVTAVQKAGYSNSGSGVGNIRIKLIDGLTVDAKGSVGFGTGGERFYEPVEYNGVAARASQSSSESLSWLVNAYLTYNKTFAGVHDFTVMAGLEEAKSKGESMSASADALPLESVGWYNLGLSAPNIGVSSGYGNEAMRSYFGRVNYSYANRYLLTANVRSDGSSRFKGNNRFSTFPSFSLAWRLSEEGFMKDQNVFQSVKVRGGWGITGSQAIGSYATYTTLGSRGFYWGDVNRPGYYARVGGNPNLKWESTKQVNLGLDVTTLDGRLSVTLDYYDKKTEDLLAPVSVPAYNGADSEYGVTSVISNVGSVMNRGFEFNINYDLLQTKDFSYDLNLNGAINRNKVLDIGEQERIWGRTYASGLAPTSPFVLMKGQPIGTIYGLKYLGIWQESDRAEAARFQQEPGDYRYENLDGADENGNMNYSMDDYQVIGNTNPKFTWGFNNHVSYRNLDLNVLFEGVHGRDILNWAYMLTAERIDFTQAYTLREARNRWTPTNTGAKFAKIGNTNRMEPMSSLYMQDGSYVKLRNVSLAYRVPKSVIPFASVKLAISAQNLLTITKYKGYDPEINSTSDNSAQEGVSDANSGMDWFAYPNPRSVSFGISLEY